MKQKREQKLTIVEWVFYPLGGLLALGGITLMILGLIADYSTVRDNALALAQVDSPLSFIHWGLIVLAVGVLITVVVLLVFAQKTDREIEKASRRAARLGKPLMSNDSIIDVDVTKIEGKDKTETIA
ncbi:MAG: hypothetical protein RBR85_00540 [Bacilli bacterium]|jgi:membrane-bound ClpP family serine protease|nr:hypothetical protein [Bacilli bacterium]